MIDPELLRNRANLATLLLGMAFFSTILANIIFLTAVWGYSVLTAGLAVVPGAVATTIVAVPAGRLAERFGHRAAIVPGCLLYVLGMAVVRGAGDEPDFLGTWLPALMLNGAGLGLALPTLAAWALQDTAPEKLASASAVQAAFRQFGGVLGTAALFAVGAPVTLAAAENAYLLSTIWALGAGIVAASRSPLPLGAVVVTGVLVFAAPAAADTNVVVDFETGPALNTPITTQYQASAFVSFSQADGYRPYRKAVGNNVGGQHRRRPLRPLEAPDDCELPIGYTSGRLTRTAKAVKLYAGLFEATGAPVTAQLLAYRADGSVAATGTAAGADDDLQHRGERDQRGRGHRPLRGADGRQRRDRRQARLRQPHLHLSRQRAPRPVAERAARRGHRGAGRLHRHPHHGHAAQWLGGRVHARRERPAAGRHRAVRELHPAPARGRDAPRAADPA